MSSLHPVAIALFLSACVSTGPAAPVSPGYPRAPASYQAPPPPPPQAMNLSLTLGFWQTNFGPVKIERDTKGSGDAVHGIWLYDRDGQEIIGYFSGVPNGNILQFHWREPSPVGENLEGEGFLAWSADGLRFDGYWWTKNRDRGGEWNGWRLAPEDSDVGPETPAVPESSL